MTKLLNTITLLYYIALRGTIIALGWGIITLTILGGVYSYQFYKVNIQGGSIEYDPDVVNSIKSRR